MTDGPGLDEVARYNRSRWEALVEAGVEYSRPYLALDAAAARALVDPHALLGDLRGKDVLCLAAGGGQQSVAFGLLGAKVTVFDLTAGQLAQDRRAAAHYGLDICTVQGDMRDLSVFADASFDLIWHAFSLSFVPDARPVFAEVRRVVRLGGFYRLEWANPFVIGLDDREWTGAGYPLTRPYIDGAEVEFLDEHWDVTQEDGTVQRVIGPKEFRHTLSTVVNTLVGHGFVVRGLWEETTREIDPRPGTWEHMKLVAPPWLSLWSQYRPELLDRPA